MSMELITKDPYPNKPEKGVYLFEDSYCDNCCHMEPYTLSFSDGSNMWCKKCANDHDITISFSDEQIFELQVKEAAAKSKYFRKRLDEIESYCNEYKTIITAVELQDKFSTKTVIDYATWYSYGNKAVVGDDGYEPSLLNEDGHKCCLGFVCVSQNIDEKLLLNEGEPDALEIPIPYLAEIDDDDGYIHNTKLSNDAIQINDNEHLKMHKKIISLIDLFDKAKHKLYFINVPENVALKIPSEYSKRINICQKDE